MDTVVLLDEMELPVVVEVTAGPERAEAQDRLGAGERPARAGAAHPILHEVAAGPLDDSGRDGQAGPHTRALADAILAERKHPEHGYRSCLGIMRLAKRYGTARLEAACRRALVVGARSYTRVESILRAGLDAAPLPGDEAPAAPGVEHENIRGSGYYH